MHNSPINKCVDNRVPLTFFSLGFKFLSREVGDEWYSCPKMLTKIIAKGKHTIVLVKHHTSPSIHSCRFFFLKTINMWACKSKTCVELTANTLSSHTIKNAFSHEAECLKGFLRAILAW